ncbi:MAG: energy transducer TonB, partial [Bacteroidales bacterium]|nr:energy transducer TonB [Bacteroidales bacterium]
TDGKVTDVKILESICEELDNMVVSAIKKSPAWEPAKVKGKPVEWAVKMPFVFELR